MEEQELGPANDLERRIIEAFEVFDHAQNKNIDVREVGAVIRSLGCCPTEAQLQEVLMEVEDPDTGSVSLDKFLPYMVNVITEYQMQPASAEALLRAFQVMDPERKGYVPKEVLVRNMLELGEPFSQDELDEMLTVAVDPETGTVPYEYYINQIMVRVEPNIYSLIPEKKQVKRRKLGGSLLAIADGTTADSKHPTLPKRPSLLPHQNV